MPAHHCGLGLSTVLSTSNQYWKLKAMSLDGLKDVERVTVGLEDSAKIFLSLNPKGLVHGHKEPEATLVKRGTMGG